MQGTDRPENMAFDRCYQLVKVPTVISQRNNEK